MRIRIKKIMQFQNREFGKKRELGKGQARVNTVSVRVLSKEEAERMTVAELTAPPEEATIEILWHDDETIRKYERYVREHLDHELASDV